MNYPVNEPTVIIEDSWKERWCYYSNMPFKIFC